MSVYEQNTTKMVLEICDYFFEKGKFPEKGILSSDGRDMGKALIRYKMGDAALTESHVELLSLLSDFMNRTEKNIQELENYYQKNHCLPIGEKQKIWTRVMSSYKHGKVPITEQQRQRLEKIGVFKTTTERMIQSIENYYHEYGEAPIRGQKSKEGYDMGNAIIGYRNGKRLLTLGQKVRLERIGISLPRAQIKEEQTWSIRVITKKDSKKITLAERIRELKKMKKSFTEVPEKSDNLQVVK